MQLRTLKLELTRSVNLGGVLARKGTTTMSSPATICVDDDLAPSQTSIPMRASNYKPESATASFDNLLHRHTCQVTTCVSVPAEYVMLLE